MLIIKLYRWLDSNRGSLVLEATALPTEPQLLRIVIKLVILTFGVAEEPSGLGQLSLNPS